MLPALTAKCQRPLPRARRLIADFPTRERKKHTFQTGLFNRQPAIAAPYRDRNNSVKLSPLDLSMISPSGRTVASG